MTSLLNFHTKYYTKKKRIKIYNKCPPLVSISFHILLTAHYKQQQIKNIFKAY